MVLYSAVSSPLDRSKPSPPAIPAFRHQINFDVNHSALLQLLRDDYTVTFPHLSIARYGELGRRGENENAQTAKQQQRGFVPGLYRLKVQSPIH